MWKFILIGDMAAMGLMIALRPTQNHHEGAGLMPIYKVSPQLTS
jgi:hypothetical protein